MSAHRPGRLIGAVVALLVLALPGAATAEPTATSTAVVPETDEEDEQLAELTATLEELLALVAAEDPDALAIPEAEEMGLVAEELLQEGDKDLAAHLLGEAIALLEEESG